MSFPLGAYTTRLSKHSSSNTSAAPHLLTRTAVPVPDSNVLGAGYSVGALPASPSPSPAATIHSLRSNISNLIDSILYRPAGPAPGLHPGPTLPASAGPAGPAPSDSVGVATKDASKNASEDATNAQDQDQAVSRKA